jgi:PAS domain S-box-containing protein
VRELPELVDRRIKVRSLAYVFLASAAVAVLTVLLPHDAEVDDLQLLLLAAAALALAGILRARLERVTDLEIHVALAAGTALVTLGNYWVESTALYPILYSWIALYAFYFLPLRWALAQVAWIGVAYGVLLGAQSPSSPAVRWLLAVITPAIAGFLVSRLVGLVRAEALRASDHARALSQSESRLRLIVESAPDAFTATDRHGIVIAWNAAAERLFGWSASEALGRPLRGLVVPAEGRKDHDARRERLLAAPDPVALERHEIELERRDGSRFPSEKTISKMVMGDETVLSIFVRDIGERRRREEQREALLREQAAREEAERVAEMVSGMQLLVDAALAHRTLDDILADLIPRVRGVLGADAASVFLVEESGRLVLAASTGGSQEQEEDVSVELGQGFAGRVAAERSPMLAHDPPTDDLVDPTIRHLPVGSLIGVPLLARDQVTGVIVVAVGAPRKFSDQDLGTLRLAADRVALAIDHARVYEREHNIAETLQRSLLPERLPNLPGLAVAARYRPAASEAEVGGDWYDVIPIPRGRVGLVMGDVAGKGLAAASMVGRLRSALRAYALEGHGPAVVVDRLNRLVWTELEESQMATLIYVVMDPAEGTLRWVNAGHLPPLLVEGGHSPRFLEGGRSVPLGVMPFPKFEEVEAGLDPGDTVVLYTDGLVERPGTHIDAGLDKVAEEVRAAPGSPEELCDHLLEAMVPEQGAADDVALLALQNTPVSEHFSVELPAEPEALAAMRGLLRRWLRHAEGGDQEIAEITTACGEAATNAIEHAGSGGGAPFEVAGTVVDHEVDITVRDYGAWREPRGGDQGRGLSLMRALMDSVEVEPGAEGTCVHLRRHLNGAGPGG